MVLEASAGLCEDVERLKERLVKHARVEEAAIKKIKDLEQVVVKRDELQVDYEVVVRKMDCLMIENERLKARIEEERHKKIEKIASIDLEAKIHDLEEQLESLREESLEDRKKLMEKCRREERLQSSLEACEADLYAETSTVKQLRERLKAEQSLRLDAESSLQELTVKKFMTPHSFVGDSLTPISHSDGSVLRQAESGRDVIPFDTLPHKVCVGHFVSEYFLDIFFFFRLPGKVIRQWLHCNCLREGFPSFKRLPLVSIRQFLHASFLLCLPFRYASHES